ncbi:Hint domain-containing protein [bacterium]|nr:Hint domain-containing protein [bacterium]
MCCGNWGAAHALQTICKGGYRVLSFGVGDRCATCDKSLGGESCAIALVPVVISRPTLKLPWGLSCLPVISPCFTPGTLIATDRGVCPIETLIQGDKVVTRDNGLRRINWVGRRTFTYDEIGQEEALQPVLVVKDAFGPGNPERSMIVSPNHRFLVGAHISPLTAGGNEALVAVTHLIDGRSVKRAPMLGVSYIHLLCNAHEVILANGTWTESFHPDDQIMGAMADTQRREILNMFPEVATMGAARRFPAARPIRKSRFET